MGLQWNTKQKRFVIEYLVDLNGTQAAIRAGYSKNSASVIANELLSKPEMKAAVQEEMDKRAERTAITADRTLKEIAKLAFSDVNDYMTWTGAGFAVKPSEELTSEQRAAVAEVTVSAVGGAKVKLYDKIRALELLGKHLKLFNDRIEVGDIVIRVAIGDDDLGEEEGEDASN